MKKIIVLLFSIILFSCSYKRNPDAKDLEHVLKITNCDSLETDSVFLKHSKLRWPISKPENMTEAMILLDSATTDFTRHYIKVCDGVNTYFGIGLKIRNNWVRHGTDDFRNELFVKLNMGHPDYTSGLILFFYKRYLSNDKTPVLQSLGVYPQSDSVRKELLRMDSEISKLKKTQ